MCGNLEEWDDGRQAVHISDAVDRFLASLPVRMVVCRPVAGGRGICKNQELPGNHEKAEIGTPHARETGSACIDSLTIGCRP
jgi:hypothetical protein